MNSLMNNRANSIGAKGLEIARVVLKMEEEGCSRDFIVQLYDLAQKYEGIFDLLNLWMNEADPKERDVIIADLQDEIEELQNAEIIKPKYLHFDNLDLIAENVMEFKKSLRTEIERWGGISKLSKATGIPIPSLSRFLKTPSLPRRITLKKIAEALNLQESDLLSKWAA